MTDLERAYVIAAEIVQKFGDIYLPLFERLHDEMKKHEAKRDLKLIALNIVKENMELRS